MEETSKLLHVVWFISVSAPAAFGLFAVLKLVTGKIDKNNRWAILPTIIGGFVGLLLTVLAKDMFNLALSDKTFGNNILGVLYGVCAGVFIGAYISYQKDSQAEKEKSRASSTNHDDFSQTTDGAGDFGFDAGRFGAKPPPPQPDENAPRGYDKRHPDDAKLWAVVDDPAASDGERRNAMDMILKREARRKQSDTSQPQSAREAIINLLAWKGKR